MTTPTLRRATARRVGALAVGMLVALTGCAGDDASQPSTTEASRDLPWPDQPYVAATKGEFEADLPLIDDHVLGAMKEFDAMLGRRDDAAAECMRNRGFGYELIDADTAAEAVAGSVLTNREFNETWGFGLAIPLQPDGRLDAEFLDVVDAGNLLNDARPGTAASFGDIPSVRGRILEPGPEAAAALDSPGPEPSDVPTCTDEANERELSGDAADEVVARGTAARELRTIAMERVKASAEVIALQERYGACMADQGYPGLTTPTDAPKSIMATFTELRQSALDTAPDGANPNAGNIDPAVVDGFKALQESERELATASFGCEVAFHSDADPASARVQQQVLDDNPALVAQLTGSS